MKNTISCRQNAWYGDNEISYRFPGNWKITVFSPQDKTRLSDDEIYTKIQNPLGCFPLIKQLKPGMKVLIISDDITRPTRTDIIIPILLNILKNAGIQSTNISILIGTGLHSPMGDHEKMLKFGKEIVDNFKIYDHDYRGKNIYAGKTRQGTPVFINRHVMESDFIIGVGGIYPHNPAGFGGGAKLILGVSGEKTIKYFHLRRKGVDAGGAVSNEFRQDLLEASRLAGLNFIINNLVDKNRNIIDIFAGDVDSAYHAGVEKAMDIFGVPSPADQSFDLVVADAYPFDSTFAFTRKGWWPIRQCGRNSYKLIISSIPNGIGNHPLFPTVPVRFPKIIDVYDQYLTSGIIDFIFNYCVKSIYREGRNFVSGGFHKVKNMIRPSVKEAPAARNLSMPATLLHGLDNDFSNQPLPYSLRSTNNLEEFTNHLISQTGNRELKVGFYQASSLTFPG